MQLMFLALVLGVLACAFAANTYPAPPVTFAASKYTTWLKTKVGDSKRGEIDIQFQDSSGNPDYVKMVRLDLNGDAKTRGFAHGALLTAEIKDFTGPALNSFLREMVEELDVSSLPEFLQKVFGKLEKPLTWLTPKLMHKAMEAVWKSEESNVSQALKDEIAGIAEGICSVEKIKGHCDVAEWTTKLQAVNMLPELIRMSCTAFGAWGKSVDPAMGGNLLQLRALDFGTGPFANGTIIQVHRNDPNNPDNAFVNVAFPGFVGAITGISQHGIGISEKVYMVYGPRSIQPGNYKGIPDPIMLRNILEYSKTKEDAIAYMQTVPRTWAMWVGVGDYASQQLNLVAYKEQSAIAYNDQTMEPMNGQPIIPEVCYVDKHPQPSHDGVNGTLPTALNDFYGKINPFTAKQIVQFHETGDVHWATYDFGAKEMQVAIGRTNSKGAYCPEDACTDDSVWKAYNRPSTNFVLADLWEGI